MIKVKLYEMNVILSHKFMMFALFIVYWQEVDKITCTDHLKIVLAFIRSHLVTVVHFVTMYTKYKVKK